jgi:hypothetical protein
VKIATPHKIGEGAMLTLEQPRPFQLDAPKPVIERPERHFLRTTRTQRRV